MADAGDAANVGVQRPGLRWPGIAAIFGSVAAAGLLASAGAVWSAGPNWHAKLPEVAQRWLAVVWPEPDWQQMAPGAYLAEVRRRGTLVVAVREYPRPAPPDAPTAAEPDGFDAEMAQFIADRLGVSLKLVGLKVSASGEAYAPPSEPVDLVVAGTGATDLPQANTVALRYSDAAMQLMVLRGSAIHTGADLRQRSVCLQHGSSYARSLATELGAVPRVYPSGVHAVYAFMAGECDALAEDASLIQRLVTREEWRFYRPVPLHIHSDDRSPEIALTQADGTSTAYLDAIVRYWQIGGAQSNAREQRAGNVSFELLQLQNGLICHS